MSNPSRAHDLYALLGIFRDKYIGPEEFWSLYQDSNTSIRVLTANIEILNALVQDPSILQASDRVSVDSALLERTLERLYGTPFERLTGREIVERAPEFLSDRAIVICGASNEARQRTKARMTGLGAQDQTVLIFDEPEPITPAPLKPIAGFFAYGYPKQEAKLEAFRRDNPEVTGIFIGVGGAVDYFAGITRRPPDWVVRLGVEWLWRLLLQPHLRLKRVLSILPLAIRLKRLSPK
ncbi:MAG: WecB/TagA/CpsF family glycosyltransferase [Maritimibacter sp.]